MSIYFSRFLLNTYSGTPYFAAHVPEDYPTSLVLQKCRSFLRLPARLRELAGLANRWAERNGDTIEGIGAFYNGAGQELNPETGRPLTDEEIDAQWAPGPSLDNLKVTDIPSPDGGFPDPDTWQPAREAGADDGTGSGPTESQILSDIAGHGRNRTAAEYGVSDEQLAGIESDEELAQFILENRG